MTFVITGVGFSSVTAVVSLAEAVLAVAERNTLAFTVTRLPVAGRATGVEYSPVVDMVPVTGEPPLSH